MPADLAALISQAAGALSRGDLAGTEQAARAALAASGNRSSDALHLLGLTRIRQGRLEEAAGLLAQADQAAPGQGRLLLNLGKVLATLGRPLQAAAAFAEAVKFQPGLAEAWRDLGSQQQHLGQPDHAAQSWRRALGLEPRDAATRLALGLLLLQTGRAAEAETMLARGLEDATDNETRAELAAQLFAAQRRQHKREAALKTATLVQGLDPARMAFDAERFDLLTELGRHDEALSLMQAMLKRAPADAQLHRHYNSLLHQLGRDDEMFASYDAAPPMAELQRDKAALLSQAGRNAEAHTVYAALLARDPENSQTLLATAAALTRLGRTGDAMTMLEQALARQPDDVSLQAGVGNAALLGGDAQKAATMLENVIARAPHDHLSLARLSTAWRLLGEERDEALMGYDELVRIFDLEAPPGFSGMAAFNAELEAALAGLHPPTREFLGQSLRGGTQTQGHLFGAGHALVERLKARIDEAVARYIAELATDPAHPLRGRKAGGFAYAGSWSSRLADCGYHTNHIHPMGWISSCYYVGLPGAVADETARQGWIKFGEPDFESGLPIRRAIQPQPGRLVLFPSYMWHGTVPFRSEDKRTTVAFDVTPT